MNDSDSSESHSERELFFEALGKSGKKERADFLDGACLGRPELRRRVEELLANHAEQDSFMEETALDSNITLPADADLSEKTGSVIDRFRLLEKLGEGGFGSVWAAEQKEPVRRRVALKIIKLGMDTKQVVARFEAERQALALMDHPNIAKVLDAGATDTGRPYFVMELVKGIAITQYCDQEKLEVNERLDLFIKVCKAIQHAHQKGIIHRDIKPSNVMITLHDGVPVPKVIDFGIAKATQQELTEKTIYTQYSQFIGTPAYMSPEQAEMSGLDIDTRSDIYSLGVLLYELLTGSTPFDAKELMNSGLDEMRKIIREREPVRPSTKLSQISSDKGSASAPPACFLTLPQDLDWIVMRCLEKDRARRYDSANGLAADLKRHLNDEPVTACPPTAAYRFQKAFRRNKLVFSAGAAVVAALVIGITVSLWQTSVARKAQRQADEAMLAERTKSRELAHQKAEAVDAREATEYANYVSLVRLAAVNLKQGNRMTAQDALLSTAPKFRNWEWRHLVNEAWPAETALNTWSARDRDSRKTVADFWRNVSVEEIARHTPKEIANMNAIAFQQTRNRVVTSPNDAAVHIWDFLSNEERITDLKKGLLTALAVSHDDRFIAAGDAKGNITILYADSGGRKWNRQSPTRKPIDRIWFSPLGKHVVTGNFDGWMEVRDANEGTELSSFTNHLETVSSVQFDKDGKSVLTASQDGTIRYWELATGRETLPAMLAPYTGRKGMSVQAINPANSREIATGDFDGEVFLWDRGTGKRLSPDIRKGSDEISHLSFSEDGTCLFVVEGRNLIRVVDRSSGEDLARIASSDQFHRFALNEEKGRIATASPTSITSVWAPVRQMTDSTITLERAHDDLVTQAAFSPDGRLVITASYDQTAKIWNTSTKELVAEFKGHTNEVLYAAFSADGERAVSVSSHGMFRVWDWDSGTGRELYHQDVHSQRFFKSASPRRGIRDMLLEYVAGFAANPFSPTNSKLVVTDGQRMLVRDGVTGEELFPLMGSTNVGWPQISPSGDLVAVMNDTDKIVNVWDLNNGQLNHTLVGHKGKAFWSAFSHDSSKLVTGSFDGWVKVWDTNEGTELNSFEFMKGFVSIARFSPDDQRIAIAGNDTVAVIWNMVSGDKSILKGPEQRITNIEFNPNPNIDRVLTTSVDNTVRIWDPTGIEGREVLQITRNSKLIYATWSPDGRIIVTCWKDGVLQLHKTIPRERFAGVIDANEMEDRIRRWRETPWQ